MGMVSAQSVIKELEKYKGQAVTVRINSGGGDVFEAHAIYNALRRHGSRVTVEVDSLAASAASFIAMAGDTISMAQNAMMMVHEAWTFAIGNKNELRKSADLLDKIDQTIRDIYAARAGTKSTAEQISELVKNETWLTAQEAVDTGLADSIGQPMNVAANIKQGRYNNTPAALFQSELPRERKRKALEASLSLSKRLTEARK